MCTRSNFFKNEPSISLDNAELFLETSKESWDDLIEAYVCPICQELILSGIIVHLKWHDDLKAKSPKPMAKVLFPHLFDDSNSDENGKDQSGNTTPDADILLKKAKRDEDKLRIVRFIDKYGL